MGLTPNHERFKDEVCALGRELGLPEHILSSGTHSPARVWRALFREKAERLIDEGIGVLEDAAMARIREDAELRIGKGFE
jgi:hypothetical protein